MAHGLGWSGVEWAHGLEWCGVEGRQGVRGSVLVSQSLGMLRLSASATTAPHRSNIY